MSWRNLHLSHLKVGAEAGPLPAPRFLYLSGLYMSPAFSFLPCTYCHFSGGFPSLMSLTWVCRKPTSGHLPSCWTARAYLSCHCAHHVAGLVGTSGTKMIRPFDLKELNP